MKIYYGSLLFVLTILLCEHIAPTTDPRRQLIAISMALANLGVGLIALVLL